MTVNIASYKGSTLNHRKSAILLLVGLMLLAVVPTAFGQEEWDPDLYLERVRTGDQLYEEAQALPIGESNRKTELLFQAALIKQEALIMLRRALLGGEVADRYLEAAQRDFFNLNENLIVILIRLDQCSAGDLLLRQALADPEALPEGGAELLSNLQPRIRRCEERVASGVRAWDPIRYYELTSEADALHQEAQASGIGDEQFQSLLYESVRLNEVALASLQRALQSSEVEEEDVPQYKNELLDVTDKTVSLLLALDLCAAAEQRLDLAIDQIEIYPAGAEATLEGRRTGIQGCFDRVSLQVAQVETVVETHEDDTDIAPWILIGTAGATLVGFFAIDAALAGDVSTLDDLRAECRAGSCNYEYASALADTIDKMRIVEGVLLGTTVIAGTVALILLLTDEDEVTVSEPETASGPQFTPWIGAGGVGASFEMRF
ncbi:MAG: hypothetical protein KC561_09020 [Myxococcales bacterium]|nr:hypothetical protein [Myxococcales bacterium]